MTTQELNLRFKSLFEAHRETIQLINRLSKFPSTPGSSPLNPTDGDPRVELGAEIHQSLKEQEEDFELLKQEVEDLTSGGVWGSGARRRDNEKDRERVALVSQVERLGGDLKVARAQFRKAQLQAKRNAEAAKRKERELLFASVQEGSTSSGPGRRRHQEKLSQDELALNASNEVTAALSRMHQLVQSELEQSQFATDTLQQGTAALTSLNESYSTLSSLLTSSRSLVSTLIHSQKSDTWYLETTFYILSATIAWLVFRRLIYGPGWWLLYLPTKLMLRFISSILTVSISLFSTLAGAIVGSGSSAAVSSVGDKISTSLIVKPSAAGGIPRFSKVMAAPSIAVGGGGKGGRAPQGNQVPSGHGSVLDQIGKIIDESQEEGKSATGASEQANEINQGTVLRERNEDERPNPKKRMFEEPSVDREQGERVRDEL